MVLEAGAEVAQSRHASGSTRRRVRGTMTRVMMGCVLAPASTRNPQPPHTVPGDVALAQAEKDAVYVVCLCVSLSAKISIG